MDVLEHLLWTSHSRGIHTHGRRFTHSIFGFRPSVWTLLSFVVTRFVYLGDVTCVSPATHSSAGLLPQKTRHAVT
jgi:hypothetical protein